MAESTVSVVWSSVPPGGVQGRTGRGRLTRGLGRPYRRLAFLMTGSNETAEEIVQDPFVRVRTRRDLRRDVAATARIAF